MDKFNEKAKQVLELLKNITEETGAFRVHTICWKNDNRLQFQCNVISLRKFIEKNNIDYKKIDTIDYRKKIIVELNDVTLYAIE